MKTSTMNRPMRLPRAAERVPKRLYRALALLNRLTGSAGARRYEMTRERELLGPIGREVRRAWWL